jgi:hypothetical protein
MKAPCAEMLRWSAKKPKKLATAIIQADDYYSALAIARASPGDNVIEIREMAGYA